MRTRQPQASELASIPGLGVIRIRSLQKAGWATMDDVRRATVEDLAAVPGISAEKAAAILEFVSARKTPAARPAARTRVRRSPVTAKSGAQSRVITAPAPEPSEPAPPTLANRLQA